MQHKLIFYSSIALYLGIMLIPELCLAQGFGGSGFESKVKGLTDSLVTVILPAISIIGLIYAAILAASGDANAKSRMILVMFASTIGFLAPVIISWLKSATGG